MSNEETGYRGSWWPPDLWQAVYSGTVSLQACVVLMQIDALAGGPYGCIAGNAWFAKKLNLSEGRVRHIISELKAAGWVKQVSFNGRQRKLAPTWEGVDWLKIASLTGQKKPGRGAKNSHHSIIEENSNTSSPGATPEKQTPPKNSGKCQRLFLKAYEAKYKSPYPDFNGAGGKAIQAVWKSSGHDMRQYKKILQAFMEEDWPAGNVLMFRNQLTKWMKKVREVESAPISGNGHPPPKIISTVGADRNIEDLFENE